MPGAGGAVVPLTVRRVATIASRMSSLDAKTVRAAIESVVDPIFDKPLGELGTLVDLVVDGANVRCRVALASPSESLREQTRSRIDEALSALNPNHVEVEWEVRVPTRETVSDDPIPQVRNVVLVMSGKGGVGKSTVATNLALALRRLGSRVGLLDADLYGPSIPTMMGIQGHPASPDGKKIEPLQRFGLKLMSVGFLLEDPKQAVIWRGPMLHGALQQFIRDVVWGELDFLIVDLPPGTGDVALTLAQKMRITGVVMVTTPQEVALADVYKGVSMCQRLSVPILGVVENMSYFEDPSGQRHELFGSGGGGESRRNGQCATAGADPHRPAAARAG